MARSKANLDILNCLGVTRECDEQRDRRTDRHIDSKCRTSLRCAAMLTDTADINYIVSSPNSFQFHELQAMLPNMALNFFVKLKQLVCRSQCSDEGRR